MTALPLFSPLRCSEIFVVCFSASFSLLVEFSLATRPSFAPLLFLSLVVALEGCNVCAGRVRRGVTMRQLLRKQLAAIDALMAQLPAAFERFARGVHVRPNHPLACVLAPRHSFAGRVQDAFQNFLTVTARRYTRSNFSNDATTIKRLDPRLTNSRLPRRISSYKALREMPEATTASATLHVRRSRKGTPRSPLLSSAVVSVGMREEWPIRGGGACHNKKIINEDSQRRGVRRFCVCSFAAHSLSSQIRSILSSLSALVAPAGNGANPCFNRVAGASPSSSLRHAAATIELADARLSLSLVALLRWTSNPRRRISSTMSAMH